MISFQIMYSILISETFLVNHDKNKNMYFQFIGHIQTFDSWQNSTEFSCMGKSIYNYVGSP